MKIMKFRNELAKQIIKGKKSSTWRLFDDKNLSKGDEVSLVIWENKQEFAKALLTEVKEKKFKELTKNDREGHETYYSDQEMYNAYSTYYNKPVTPESQLKVIKFKLIRTNK